MRKTITAVSFAALTAIALATPAMAQPRDTYYPPENYAAPIAGAAVGTAVGVGLYNGWYGTTPAIAGSVLPTTVAGAVAVGGVAGIGTVALIDGVIQPCHGFQALFGANKDACVNGEYVGYAPPTRHIYRR